MPLELLVERAGSDSLLGATRATLRVPSFMDDVVSAMRQMGQYIARLLHQLQLTIFFCQICQSRVSSGRMEISDG